MKPGRPRLGTWIETPLRRIKSLDLDVVPAWGRGLKQEDEIMAKAKKLVVPAWGRGLKQLSDLVLSLRNPSSPLGDVD